MATTDALIMAGSGMPVVDENWMNVALGGECTPHAVDTPAQFWPFTGRSDMALDESTAGGLTDPETALAVMQKGHADAGDPGAGTVIFGYSQSTVIAIELKRRLAADTATGEAVLPVTFVLIANLTRITEIIRRQQIHV